MAKEAMRMNKYTPEKARNDLIVINWLLSAGAITHEEARNMRNYVTNLK